METGWPIGVGRLERVKARPRERVEVRLENCGWIGRDIVSNGGAVVPMEMPARIPASNDGNFVKPGLMLLPVCFLVLPPAEEEEDGQRDDNAHAANTGAKGSPIELNEGGRFPGLVDDSVVICLSLFGGLGRGRSL